MHMQQLLARIAGDYYNYDNGHDNNYGYGHGDYQHEHRIGLRGGYTSGGRSGSGGRLVSADPGPAAAGPSLLSTRVPVAVIANLLCPVTCKSLSCPLSREIPEDQIKRW